MRRSSLARPAVMLVVGAALAAAAAGCGGDGNAPREKATPSPEGSATFGDRPTALTGGKTTLRLAATTSRLFDLAGVDVEPTGEATFRGGAFVFPITGGRLQTAPLRGRIELAGGLRLSAARQSVEATDLIVDPTTDVVSARIRGRRVPLLSLDVGRPSPVPPKGGTQVVIPADASLLGGSAVRQIGGRLHLDLLTRGMRIGRLVVSARA